MTCADLAQRIYLRAGLPQELAELLVKEQGKPMAMALAECGMCWGQMEKVIDTELPVELYSEDEDFNPAAEAKIQKKSPKKSPKKKTLSESEKRLYEKFHHIFPNAAKADAHPVDEELQALVEDAEVITEYSWLS